MPSRTTLAAMALVCATLAAALSACGGAPGATPCPTSPMPHGLAIAVGGHANGAVPSWPTELDRELDDVVASGDPTRGVALIRVDGRPSVGCVVTYDTTGGNDTAREAARRAFVDTVRQRTTDLAAQQPESDPLGALGIAAEAAGPGGTVVLMDSGLQTVAPLDFRRPGLLDADIDDVVEQLAASGSLPPLAGRDVVLTNIGYTAEPQAALSAGQRAHLVELWRQIAVAAGATSTRVIEIPSTTVPRTDLPAVTTVDVPEPRAIALGCGTESILADDGPVGFRQNSTEFADPAAATPVLTGLAGWLRDNPTARVEIVGSIAHYGDSSPAGLSGARAERVRSVLIDDGVAPAQVAAVGVGWGPFPTSSAPPDPVSDPLNRRVVVKLDC